MPILVNDARWGKVQFPDDATNEEIVNYFIKLEAQEGPEFSTGEVLYRAAERGLTSTARGLEQKFVPESFRNFYYGEEGVAAEDAQDRANEQEFRVMLEQQPELSYSSLIAGSIADPITLPLAFLKVIKLGGAALTGAARTGTAGAIGGAIEPTYEEYGDSQVMNIVAGGAFGFPLGAAVGKFFPRAVGFGETENLDNEVDNAIESVARREQELQTNKAVDDAAEIQVISQRASAGMLPPAAAPQIGPLQGASPVARLQQDLEPIVARALPKQEVQTLQGSIKAIDNELAALDRFKPKRGKAGAGQKDARVKELNRQRLDIQQRLNEARDAQIAQRDLNALRAGRPQDLTEPNRIKFQEYQATQVMQPRPLAQAVAPQQLAPEQEALIQGINTRIGAGPRQMLPPTPQTTPQVPTYMVMETGPDGKSIVVRKRKEELTDEQKQELIDRGVVDASEFNDAPQGRAPLGLDPLPGVGSTGARPSAQFVATSPDAPGDAAVRRAVFGTRRNLPEPDRLEVMSGTEAERAFHSRLQAESAEQLIRLRNETYYQGLPTNRYSWNNVTQGAVQVENRILEDYNDLTSWLLDQGSRLLNALELEVITPLIKESQERLADARLILYSLQRAGNLDSEEAVKVMQDIQFYNVIGNAGYIAQKTNASNVMKQLGKMKPELNRQNQQLAKGKPIDQIMFGVTC
jgi:hypothetical protein